MLLKRRLEDGIAKEVAAGLWMRRYTQVLLGLMELRTFAALELDMLVSRRLF